MKTITYTLRLPRELYNRVEAEADKRNKKLSEIFRDLIAYGFESLPPLPDSAAAVADTWEKLGPAPDVNYDNVMGVLTLGGRCAINLPTEPGRIFD